MKSALEKVQEMLNRVSALEAEDDKKTRPLYENIYRIYRYRLALLDKDASFHERVVTLRDRFHCDGLTYEEDCGFLILESYSIRFNFVK